MPSGCDLYLLSHIIHDWDDERAIKVLQACRRAMAPSARLLILDRVMPERVLPDPMVQGKILVDLVMMVGTSGGRERTASEFQALFDGGGPAIAAGYPDADWRTVSWKQCPRNAALNRLV